eukprot:1139683-Pelagomonas_calceolata.AAC.1
MYCAKHLSWHFCLFMDTNTHHAQCNAIQAASVWSIPNAPVLQGGTGKLSCATYNISHHPWLQCALLGPCAAHKFQQSSGLNVDECVLSCQNNHFQMKFGQGGPSMSLAA